MPSPKKHCPTCDGLMCASASQCRKCKPSYQRTKKHRQFSRLLHLGKKHSYPSASIYPEIAQKIRLSWTKKKRELARKRGIENAKNSVWRKKCGSVREKNPRWEGGRSEVYYQNGFSRGICRLVRERDKVCQDCSSSKNLCVHHIDFEKINHSLENLVLLCRSCHTIRHLKHKGLRSLAKIVQSVSKLF